jgi:hypothetical protein
MYLTIRDLCQNGTLLFEYLRLGQALFDQLDHSVLTSLAGKYNTVTLETFLNYLRRYADKKFYFLFWETLGTSLINC